MGLALLMLALKIIAIRKNDDRYNQAARFWAKIFAINFVFGVVGAFYVLSDKVADYGKMFVKVGVITGAIACALQLFATGDVQGKMVAFQQPATLAAMEGLFKSEEVAALVILGQPNIAEQKLDNPVIIPRMLSFLTYPRWKQKSEGWILFQEINGLTTFRCSTSAFILWLGSARSSSQLRLLLFF